ncbi:MAG TPA: Maf family protein [Puia sp.]|nr:Maf family protein [Puia sp.]
MNQIVLASQSPRRKQLLQWAEVKFDIIVKETDESYPENIAIEEIAIHIARNKANAVKKEIEGEKIIIAADTIVVLDKDIIGKPKNREDAINILKRLSGNKHLVMTGVVMIDNDKEIAFADTTEVWFHHLNDEQISFYIDKYKPYDKAGAYAIQEWIGVIGIKKISGDFYNVMGLPVSRVVKELSNFMK